MRVWGQLMRLGYLVSAREPKPGESMETQTHTTDIPLEPGTMHRSFHFHEALFNGRSLFYASEFF